MRWDFITGVCRDEKDRRFFAHVKRNIIFSPNRVRGSSVLLGQSRLEFQKWMDSMKPILFQQKSTYFASPCSLSDSPNVNPPFFQTSNEILTWIFNDLVKRYESKSKCMLRCCHFWRLSIKPQRRSIFFGDSPRSLKRYYSKSKCTSDAETLL